MLTVSGDSACGARKRVSEPPLINQSTPAKDIDRNHLNRTVPPIFAAVCFILISALLKRFNGSPRSLGSLFAVTSWFRVN